jgi:beta-glucosidase
VSLGADLAIVVVGFTRRDEGEYIGAGMNDALQNLMPPTQHPVLGFSDPGMGERFGDLFKASSGVAGGTDHSGGDRESLRLSAEHEELIAAATRTNDHVVVVVISGSAVVCPWLETTSATLMLWYAGSEAGRALGDILCGEAEPSGRLPFAIPREEENLVPFEREAKSTRYALLHGQWHLDAEKTPAHKCFGYGLGYTTFQLSNIESDGQSVCVEVTNTGSRFGATVVQVYGSVPGSKHLRPEKRLVGFSKVRLDRGQAATLRIPVDVALLDLRLKGEWVREEKPIILSVGLDADSATPV